VLKPLELNESFEVSAEDLNFFLGKDFLITVQEGTCPPITDTLNRAHGAEERLPPDQLFYRIMDQLIDSYYPLLDRISDHVDDLEDKVVTAPDHTFLEQIFDLKRSLIEMRRILANTRDLLGHLTRTDYDLIQKETMPFIRDVYDHVIRNLDTVEIHRDLLTSTTELYLSSVANRTNQVVKALTIFGAVATPALVITGVYGMNLKHLPFAEHPHSWGIVMTIIGLLSGGVLLILYRLRWW
jgi:magnesium transporter